MNDWKSKVLGWVHCTTAWAHSPGKRVGCTCWQG